MKTNIGIALNRAVREYATFEDSDIRDGVYELIETLDNDLQEQGYEAAESVETSIGSLEGTMDEFDADKAAEEEQKDTETKTEEEDDGA